MSATREVIDNFIAKLKLDEVSTLWEEVLSEAAERKVSLKDPHDFIKVAMQQRQWNSIKPVLQFKQMIDEQDENGNTRLHRAVSAKKYYEVKLLLSYCAATNIANKAGLYPLGLAKEDDIIMQQILIGEGRAHYAMFNQVDSGFVQKNKTHVLFQRPSQLNSVVGQQNMMKPEFK